ncbi:MAG: hypothetical protein DRJ20_01210 [Candidatus Methanomethylicota archaeon]|uniref:Uncharacterized protein n=1 Tax=Thermoproteota archaeon TaxID=2056631 RepID=A0A497EZ13_9CREN|nr:MAG: hypothetical protein DRJ20_01210 [Candidatus Verstraetearchaeota archaeon]
MISQNKMRIDSVFERKGDVESLSLALVLRGKIPAMIISSEGLDAALNELLAGNYALRDGEFILPSRELKSLYNIKSICLPSSRVVKRAKSILTLSFLVDALTFISYLKCSINSAILLLLTSILMKAICIWRLMIHGSCS